MQSYNFTIATDTANGKFDSESLTKEIRASAIVTSLNYISSDATTITVWFNASLSPGDQTILTSVVAAHLGIPSTQKDAIYDEDGRLITSAQPSLLGSGTWLVSDNICSANLPSTDSSWGGNPPASIGTTHANGDVIVYEWIPSAGKKLYCLETQLILSPNVDLSSVTCHFMGINCGTLGNTAFDRKYLGEWGRTGYRTQADEVYESAEEKRFYWRYTVPIILKSSANAKITLTRAGQMTGTLAYVKIKVISLNE